jgi:asparagine synthase (glutamine-hydrolysing)
MCGIFGSINVKIQEQFSLDSLKHRGPDGFGVWRSADLNLVFAHRRLSILDTSDLGKQPMHGWGLAITLNGEIYNFLEIRNELKRIGYSFQSETDTEVVLAAYKHWGKLCVNRFNGMWALAIWDHQKQELFLSRDRFGKKPFYYFQKNNQFIFSSEMKAILPYMPEVNKHPEFNQFSKHLFNYEATEACLIDGIKKLPAGTIAYYRPNGERQVEIERFWHPDKEQFDIPKKYTDQVMQFRALFEDACRIRMRSDVPIGTALSGGVDSSAVICTLAHVAKQSGERMSTNWQNAFVAGFPNTFLDETRYAKQVTDYLNIPVTFIEIDPIKALDNFWEAFYLQEDLYLTSPFPMMQTYQNMHKNGIRVSIDGHGADELLSGYGSDLLEAFHDAGFNKKAIQNIIETYNANGPVETTQQISKRHFNWNDYHQAMKKSYPGRKNLYTYYLKSCLRTSSKKGQFNQVLYTEFYQTILPTLLRNYDRYSMSQGIETRMPFMDYRLVSFCQSLPWESKIRNGYTKSIVRDALEPIMPYDVIRRKGKIGFNTPIIDWLRGPWKAFFLDMLYSKSCEESELIDTKAMRQEFDILLNNTNYTFAQAEQFWIKLSPYIWEQSFLKQRFWKPQAV